MQTYVKPLVSFFLGAVVVAVILAAMQANAQDSPVIRDEESEPAANTASAPSEVEHIALNPVAPVIGYQGQLLDPFTNQPKPDGVYPMTFTLYDANAGGSVLWTEAKSVVVSGGLFSTFLGELTPLNLAIFNGQILYLGVKVGTDPEATPRQRLSYAPYALYAGNADTLDGLDSSAFARVDEVGGSGALAFGFVDTNGTRGSGTNNWTSEFRDDVYLIRIDGTDYNFREFATVVTAACNFPRIPNTGSSEGRLLVEFFAPNGNHETCRFHFVVFKP
jgi:hypothetical protein